MKLTLAGFVVGSCALTALSIGCGRANPDVVYRIPAGYRGVFAIKKDARGESVTLDRGAYTYHIPKSGVLTVEDRAPLEAPHADKAFYADGSPLPVDGLESVPANEVGLFNLGTDQDGTTSFLIGTGAEYRHVREQMSDPGSGFVVKPGPLR